MQVIAIMSNLLIALALFAAPGDPTDAPDPPKLEPPPSPIERVYPAPPGTNPPPEPQPPEPSPSDSGATPEPAEPSPPPSPPPPAD